MRRGFSTECNPVNFNYVPNQLESDEVIPNRKLDEIGIVVSMKHFH